MKQEKFVIKDDKKIEKEDYILICQNTENSVYYATRPSIILIKDGNQYFPIFNLKKGVKDSLINIGRIMEPSSVVVKNIIEYSKDNCVDLINK